MTMPGRERRATLMRVATATWLLLISAAVVIDHVALSRLAEQLETRAAALRVDGVEQRLAELAQQIELSRREPNALPQARYESDRVALERRLAAIEQALGSRQSAEYLLPLQARVEQLEAKLAAPRPSTPPAVRPRPSTPAAVRSAPTEPPFQIIGLELRADELFLSILPAGTATVSQVRLLRPSEAEAGWRLDAIDGATALFRHDDETRRLAIPGRQAAP
ncbi:hypothetical protein FA454_14325 [Pseudomonas aeruginosa]|uniref:hypothetical protein n=1 Tax=Pseudomonas aeruginosa TaxID=287 RepID=UPI00071B7238|nr:hypothetical protein [Pseudomonas aeruginosa]KSQ24948.1 hypothetical protein APB28_00265 [Pseudomonas aeruginosa]MCO1686911.1 hypothetical protein [Pseudomonas aeruginosa]MCO1780326.1 hypothetical protein [Pseudomonas aeruginosa]MCO1790188.1 hypothetical protein [Pseudomonas aeruginosa]MCO1799172.1 hypothetical protein [Pseudomonas aeruginosa]